MDAGSTKFTNVLLVDDEAQIAELYKHVLNKSGMQVQVATNGQTALQLLRQQKFDIAFVDVMMPDINGITLLKSIRTENINPDMAIVLLTNIEEDAIIQQGFALGMQAFMIKSQLAPLQLVDIIKNNIKLKAEGASTQTVNPSANPLPTPSQANAPATSKENIFSKLLSIFFKK